MAKKLIVIILCVCMLFNFAAQPVHAMGAEGIIIGGAAAAGVTLTVGQVALIAAAAFGLVYAATHADELGAMLESALSAAVSNDETRQQQLTNWKTRACSGFIALATAPAWIKGILSNVVSSQYETYNSPDAGSIACSYLPAGEATCKSVFWGNATPNTTFDKDVTVIRAGSVATKTLSGTLRYILGSYFYAVSLEEFTDSDSITISGTKYYYKGSFSSLSPEVEGLAGNNLAAYEAISALPNFNELKALYPSYSNAEQIVIGAWADGLISAGGGSICPDVTVGGIGNALNDHSIDNINIPDINVGQSDLLVPDNTASINDTLGDVLTRLEQQELTWQQYMDDVAVGTPTVSVPAEGTQTGTLEYPLTDTGVSDVPIDTTQPDNPSTSIPEGIEPYTLDLRTFFPFCIPFDIVKFVDTLCAEPEAPCFTWGIATPDGGTEEMEVDLAVFDPVAEILRGMELLLFIIGLAFLTRALIRG